MTTSREDTIILPPLSIRDTAGKRLLHTPELALPRGETLAIVGPSGAGKSLFLKSLFGWSAPGQAATFSPRRDACLMIQDPAQGLTPGMSLAEHFREVARDKDWRREAEALTAALSLDGPDLLARTPRSFSGGERQRLMLALALTPRPRILCCDEPAASLDAANEAALWRLLQRVRESRRLTLIFVTHRLELAARHADRAAVFHRGEIVFWGRRAAFFDQPEHPYHRALIAAHRRRESGVAASEPIAKPAGAPRLSVSSFSLSFGTRRLFEDFGLALDAGEWVWLTGPSGSGKTSLAKFIAGLVPRASGEIRLDGRVLPATLGRRNPDQRRAVQLLFQHGSTALNPAISANRQLRRAYGGDHARLRDDLAKLGLAELDLDRRPDAFSLGEQQRLCLLRALAPQPRAIICDEPAAALDLALKERILDFLDAYRRRAGAAVLAATNDSGLLRLRPARTIALGGSA